jgi:hypothetical protein
MVAERLTLYSSSFNTRIINLVVSGALEIQSSQTTLGSYGSWEQHVSGKYLEDHPQDRELGHAFQKTCHHLNHPKSP